MRHRFYEKPLSIREIGDRLFVFGSNNAGRHGMGAALFARRNFGARYGQGHGHQGQSWAIATKDWDLNILTLSEIDRNVSEFLYFTLENFDLSYYVTPVGTGLAGYGHEDIAPMFRGCVNCVFPSVWKPYLM